MPNISFKGIAVAAALAVGPLALSNPAEARSNVPGIIAGVAVGAIIAGAVTRHNRPYYRDHGHSTHYYAPAPRYYAPPPPTVVYSYAPRPWSGEWYAYCAQKYRSFDARSGTFQPYHGPRQLCR